MPKEYLIYGVTGYTGELIAREAAKRGHKTVLAGRNASAVARLGAELGLPTRAFSLDNPRAVDAGIAGMALVLNTAGPFARTASPIVGACLESKIPYLDICGEIAVLEMLAARDEEAKRSGVLLLPGVGFDVVPSDCLAAHLKARLPSATRLTLAFRLSGKPSHGTATVMVESLGTGGKIRREGRLEEVPLGKVRRIDFGEGAVPTLRVPWSDLATAYFSTGIAEIETYLAVPRAMRVGARLHHLAKPLLASSAFQGWAKRRLDRSVRGPSEDERARGGEIIWGEVTDHAGRRESALMKTGDAYGMTVIIALAAVERLATLGAQVGFQTPSRVFGADFILGMPGVSRQDI